MYDLNKVMLIGRLTKDPDVRSTNTGTKVTTITVATTISKNKETGQENTQFIDCVCWGKVSDIAESYLRKGNQVYVEGYMQTRSWEGADGKKNYKTEVVANQLKSLSPKNTTPNQVSSEVDIDLDLDAPF